jgi:hypothetical protein
VNVVSGEEMVLLPHWRSTRMWYIVDARIPATGIVNGLLAVTGYQEVLRP